MKLLGDMSAEDVSAELRAARIYETRSGNEAENVAGHLGPFRFTRCWYYWRATGPMPMSSAVRLYEDPIGRQDIRVDSNSGRPPPDESETVVWSYDIDSLAGLRLFADTIREIGLHPEGLSPRAGR